MDQLSKGKARKTTLYARKRDTNRAKKTGSGHNIGSDHNRRSNNAYSLETLHLNCQPDIYNLKLNQSASIGHMLGIYTRVPGGWVYTDGSGCCFIPYSEEFIDGLKD